MKNIALVFIVILPLFSFSQEALTVKGDGRVFNSNNQKLTSNEVRDLFATNAEALKLYNAGRSKKTIGNILLCTGGITIVGKFISNKIENSKNKPELVGYGYFGNPIIQFNGKTPTNNLFIVGGAMVLIALPIKIGFLKKIKKSVSLINEDIKNPKTGFNIDSTTFISNSDGFGISITF